MRPGDWLSAVSPGVALVSTHGAEVLSPAPDRTADGFFSSD